MRKIFILFFILFFTKTSFSQDVGVVSIASPNTGCMLSSSETVAATVFNFGGTTIDTLTIAYTINGGAPVLETVIINTAFSTYTHTFTVTANLSVPGSYTIKSYTIYNGDINASNDTTTKTISSDPFTVGGTVNGSTTVCVLSNSGTLTLTGHTGTVTRWELSTNGGSTWTNVANTTTSQSYTNITNTTLYRVLVKSGTCPSAYSDTATISVDAASVGGTISGSDTVCNPNSGSLTLSGHTGNVQFWEFSEDGGTTWAAIANTTATQTYTNLATTTIYRAIVKSGSCPQDTSGTADIVVAPATVGGTLAGSATVCSGSNSGTLSLTGNTGSVLKWEYSTDGGATWNDSLISDSSLTFNNLTTTTEYRVLVQSCNPEYSSTAAITVDPVSVGGALSGGTTVCSGSNSGDITLSGNTGNIVDWETSTDGGTTWAGTGSTVNPQPYTNLTVTTMYRAIVQSGVCPPDTSPSVTITVDPASVGGQVAQSATVCISGNGDMLNLSGYTGNVQQWEFSDDGGTTWNIVANTTAQQPYSNLLTTTIYRALVQSGTCPAAYSDTATVIVNSLSEAGIISGGDTVCHGSNSGSLSLSGSTGSILAWQLSADSGTFWTDINNATASETYSNLAQTTYYRAVVQSSGCPADTSANAVVAVFERNINAGNDTSINIGAEIILQGRGGVSYTWSPATALDNLGIAGPVAKPVETTSYILTITDSNGCVASDTVTITVIADFNFVVPNLVTRNGDGKNETWHIKYIEAYPTSEVVIFNSYGKEVFSASPYMNEFDGNGFPDGTYYYILRFKNSDFNKKGAITILSGD